MSPSERIAKMKRDLTETKAVLDGCVIHPSDTEGRRMLEQRLESNRVLTDLVEKMETVFLAVDEQRTSNGTE